MILIFDLFVLLTSIARISDVSLLAFENIVNYGNKGHPTSLG